MAFFDITHKDPRTRARTGIIHTNHGDIETPIFMPVGTQATVKSLDSRDVADTGAQIILGNTYHLHLRPGEEIIANAGGLHQFMNWNKPILTDSGGFQVFSLGAQKHKNSLTREPVTPLTNQTKMVSIDEEGVTFRSYIDGSEHRFTPEKAIEIQHKLGADIIMAFDECTPDGIDEQYTRDAMDRTHRWAKRCLAQHENMKAKKQKNNYRQFLFGIVQGSNHRALREESARVISQMDFDGIALGGESIGYNMSATTEILDWVWPLIPEDKPHYTMGVGFSPLDLFDVVEHGADMFDCVSPTRMARNGTLFAHSDTLHDIAPTAPFNRHMRFSITNAQFRNDSLPIDPLCDCTTCKTYSRQYLHHLFKAEELLAYRLATIHNVHFFVNLMTEMRQAIREDKFLELKKKWM